MAAVRKTKKSRSTVRRTKKKYAMSRRRALSKTRTRYKRARKTQRKATRQYIKGGMDYGIMYRGYKKRRNAGKTRGESYLGMSSAYKDAVHKANKLGNSNQAFIVKNYRSYRRTGRPTGAIYKPPTVV